MNGMSQAARKYCSSSCYNCRIKKRKCDGAEVCRHCMQLGLSCERASKDRRTHRLTSSEIQQLQDEAAHLKATLARVRELSQESNSEVALREIKELFITANQLKKQPKSRKKIPVSVDASGGGVYSVFGPTSAFLNLVDNSDRLVPPQTFDNGLLNTSQLSTCLKSFFKWMYPDVTVFIHRESFLSEFLNSQSSQGYCSEELVYAIAALGAKSSPLADVRALAQNFFETARHKILTTQICLPQINTLQALLCLSLYELGEGNASASWMLSGMAIRMGYDLGFQLDPKDWSIEAAVPGDAKQSLISDINVMVRSRIYWGCYIVDHFVSLIMGRPVTVRKTEASIPTSEVLPNAKDIDGYVFSPIKSPHSVRNLDAFQTIEPLCLLSECVGSLLTDIYTGEATDEALSYLNKIKLAKYNGFLASWRRKLPIALRWTESSMSNQDYNPTVANYRLFYYVVLICLNRPFCNFQIDVFLDQSPQDLLNTAIAELGVLLLKFNESMIPPSILIVYSSILGLSVSLMQIQGISEADSISPRKAQELKTYYTTVSKASDHWRLAAKSLLLVRKKVKDIHHPILLDIFGKLEVKFDSENDLAGASNHETDTPFWTNQDYLFANFFDFLDHN